MKIILILFLLFGLTTKQVAASEEFYVNSSVYYDIATNGDAQVTHYITLENNFTDIYAKSYTIFLNSTSPIDVKVFEGKLPLAHELKEEAGNSSILINFPDSLVGRGKKRSFSVSYKDSSFVTRNGDVREVIIPHLADTTAFDEYSLTILVPPEWGKLAYASPEADNIGESGGKRAYTFNKEKITASPAKIAFGDFQSFSFDLTYHLENPLHTVGFIEVPVPPDTSFQKIIISNITPPPSNISIDKDGNWLAKFILSPRAVQEVRVQGFAQIYSYPRGDVNFDGSQLEANLAASDVWQTNDPKIIELANRLKTPQKIYEYVVETLNYDYERVKPNAPRLGALAALNSPKNAICMEFTDLFIAIARAAGIPAREINGYAYTENKKIEPLSLVLDVLHAWPEYWDEKRGVWVGVDPTWGKTSGLDYYSKLDLRHITFAIHGTSPYIPYPPGSYKLGPNPQKDIFVSFAAPPANSAALETISITPPKFPFFRSNKISVQVKNDGQVSTAKSSLHIYFDERLVHTFPLGQLPPYASSQFEIDAPISLLGHTLPSYIQAQALGKQQIAPTHKKAVLTLNLIALLSSIALTLTLLFLWRKKVHNNNLKFQKV